MGPTHLPARDHAWLQVQDHLEGGFENADAQAPTPRPPSSTSNFAIILPPHLKGEVFSQDDPRSGTLRLQNPGEPGHVTARESQGRPAGSRVPGFPCGRQGRTHARLRPPHTWQ